MRSLCLWFWFLAHEEPEKDVPVLTTGPVLPGMRTAKRGLSSRRHRAPRAETFDLFALKPGEQNLALSSFDELHPLPSRGVRRSLTSMFSAIPKRTLSRSATISRLRATRVRRFDRKLPPKRLSAGDYEEGKDDEGNASGHKESLRDLGKRVSLRLHGRAIGLSSPRCGARVGTEKDEADATPRPSPLAQTYFVPGRRWSTQSRCPIVVPTPERSVVDPRLTPPTSGELEVIEDVTCKTPVSSVVATIACANITLQRRDMASLRDKRWLNDEVMNAFVALINARNTKAFSRSERNQHGCWRPSRPRTYVFNTFFYTRLLRSGYDYDGVKRWPRRANIDVASLDLVLVPVNIENVHWVLAAIDARQRMFLYMDSMHNPDSTEVLNTLRTWYSDELAVTKGAEGLERIDIKSWGSLENPEWVPQQRDSGSCGVFSMYMADYLELGKVPEFKDYHVTVMRQRAILFLVAGRLPEA